MGRGSRNRLGDVAARTEPPALRRTSNGQPGWIQDHAAAPPAPAPAEPAVPATAPPRLPGATPAWVQPHVPVEDRPPMTPDEIVELIDAFAALHNRPRIYEAIEAAHPEAVEALETETEDQLWPGALHAMSDAVRLVS